ncbi:hypothetical protein [Zavarzinella formosa]|uniref:hypothetical protein n=1 Tax=Zavarzinella formosa TaxID=360055 RepID=UPI00030A566E|nr:hypothetical protein [Zavarzinella formosa]
MAAGTHLISLAEATLCVPADASADSRRNVFLSLLDEENYIPSTEALESAAVLGILPWEGVETPALVSKFEQVFNERLEKFVGEYWDLEPDQRRAEWEILNGSSEPFPKHRLRLRDLQAGLHLKMPPDLDNIFTAVARCLETAYLLPLTMRADRVAEICEQENLQMSDFRVLVRLFLREHRGFDWVIATLGVLEGQNRNTVSDHRDVVRRKPQTTVPAENQKNDSKAGTMILIGIVCMCGLGLFTGLRKEASASKVRFSASSSAKVESTFGDPSEKDNELKASLQRMRQLTEKIQKLKEQRKSLSPDEISALKKQFSVPNPKTNQPSP